jgi:hypothetical protein
LRVFALDGCVDSLLARSLESMHLQLHQRKNTPLEALRISCPQNTRDT